MTIAMKIVAEFEARRIPCAERRDFFKRSSAYPKLECATFLTPDSSSSCQDHFGFFIPIRKILSSGTCRHL